MRKQLIVSLLLAGSASAMAQTLSQEELGQVLFFDPNLSLNRTQSCGTCHDPAHAFSDQRDNQAKGQVSLGDDGHSFGTRNAPTAMYAKFVPRFHYNAELKEYVGGLFLDGRVDDLAGQAGGPPLNPVEMAMPNKGLVAERLQANPVYVENFEALFGADIFKQSDDPEHSPAYDAMTEIIAAYEKTDEFSPFDSKYDKFLRGEYELTVLEDLGRSLFFSERNVNCSTCHSVYREDDPRETFTNHQYRNIGVPKNPEMMALSGVDADFIDQGLLDNPQVDDPKYRGKFRNPTLRNVAVTGPYMHNGVFKDLRTVVEFYDHYNNPERSINPETGEPWGEAEVPDTIDLDELRAQVITDRKVDALVAFMKTLTDERYEHLLE